MQFSTIKTMKYGSLSNRDSRKASVRAKRKNVSTTTASQVSHGSGKLATAPLDQA
jgi:hypothetical protein